MQTNFNNMLVMWHGAQTAVPICSGIQMVSAETAALNITYLNWHIICIITHACFAQYLITACVPLVD